MTKLISRWWLAAALLYLAPVAFAGPTLPPCTPGGPSVCLPDHVPDGGSLAIYVLVVGATCLGAMLIRSRTSK